jgi:hypothetical protein
LALGSISLLERATAREVTRRMAAAARDMATMAYATVGFVPSSISAANQVATAGPTSRRSVVFVGTVL